MSVSQYIKQGRDYNFSGPFDTSKRLPAGVYNIRRNSRGEFYVQEHILKSDNIIEIADSPAKSINAKVKDFFNSRVKEAFDRYNMVYKRGILLYGPPGTGKTSIIHLIIRTAIENDMVIFLNPEPWMLSGTIQSIRDIEGKDRSILVVWEEFENILFGYESEILDMLDGVNQTPNTFYIATTNYIDKIPPRVKNRPSRFAEVIEIGAPDPALRRAYLQAKIHPEDKVDLDEWVEKTEGFVIDHLKDLIISNLVLKIPLDEAINKIRDFQPKSKKSGSSERQLLKTLLETMKNASIDNDDDECNPIEER